MKHFKISYFIILWINYRIRDSNPNSVFFFYRISDSNPNSVKKKNFFFIRRKITIICCLPPPLSASRHKVRGKERGGGRGKVPVLGERAL